MKTKEKTVSNGGLLLTCTLLLSSFFAKADVGKIAKSISDGMSNQGVISFYIIGIILGLGITGYIIVSIIEKRREKYEKEHPTNIKHITHRHHHHHHQRVVKKSA